MGITWVDDGKEKRRAGGKETEKIVWDPVGNSPKLKLLAAPPSGSV